MTSSKDDFKVGYKKPPQHSRFKPGMSGNPRGRQRGVRNLGSDVKRTLKAPVVLSEDGKTRRVSTQEAALKRLREKALKGDARALDRLLSLALIYNNEALAEAMNEVLPAEDQAILDAYASELLSRPSIASAKKQGDSKDDGPKDDE